ncbi:MAG: radical SAM protein [Candidatus Dojkabacteria bacterium]
MKISTIQSKSALTLSKLPGVDYVINPYSGCAFGCAYCYADFMRRFTGHIHDKWGEYVDIKTNLPDFLQKDLKRIEKRQVKQSKFKTGRRPVIFFGSVTDPYQGVEAKYMLTRKCLEIILKSDADIEVSMLTKSPLITRDIDLLKQIKNLSVGLTITSTDDSISKLFECNAPSVTYRLKALKELKENSIEIYAFVGPLLPHFVTNEKSLDNLFKSIKETGCEKVWVEHLNLSGTKKNRLINLLKGQVSDEVIEQFGRSQTKEYKEELSSMVKKILEKYNLKLTGGDIIDHREVLKS